MRTARPPSSARSAASRFVRVCAGGDAGAAQDGNGTVLRPDRLNGLGETLDPERLRALLARYFEGMKTIVERHGGSVEKFIGMP